MKSREPTLNLSLLILR